MGGGLREGGNKKEGRQEEEGFTVGFWNVAGLRNKDRGFWRDLADWDLMVLCETWLDKKGKDKGLYTEEI